VRATICKFAVAAGVDRGLHLADHFGQGHHRLAGEMSALFGKHLILDLDARGAGAFKHADGAPDVD
jgi:hypothetical protein